MNARLPLAILMLALAGCGQGSPAARRPAPAPSPTAAGTAAPAPAAHQTLIAVSEASSADQVLELVTVDGRPVARTVLPSARTSGWPGVGGGMLTFVDGGMLKGLTPAGTVETLGPVPGWTGGAVAVSPDGQRWMWSTSTVDTATGMTSSRLLLGTRGASDRVVASLKAVGRALEPLRWNSAGPTYHSSPIGIGGYIPFGDLARGPSYRFDPATGQVTEVLARTDCVLADLAADGTIACIRQTDRSLALVSPAGGTSVVTLPAPAFSLQGAVSFGPGAATLAIGGAEGIAPPGQERYTTGIFDVTARALRLVGPAGLRPASGPWSWLPDGSLLAYRPEGPSAGDPGIQVIAPDGTARRVLASGTPLGVIDQALAGQG